jgi:hypothetical protein
MTVPFQKDLKGMNDRFESEEVISLTLSRDNSAWQWDPVSLSPMGAKYMKSQIMLDRSVRVVLGRGQFFESGFLSHSDEVMRHSHDSNWWHST